jgi:hypothetical protein
MIKISDRNDALSTRHKLKKPGHVNPVLFLIIFPVFTIFLGEFTFQASKSMINFIFPFFFHDDGIASKWIYLVIFFQQVSQISAIFLSSKLKQNWKLPSVIAAILAMIGCNSVLILQQGIIMVTCTVVATGFFGGLVYAFATRILFSHGTREKSLRYSTINETVSSTGFGMMPLMGGLPVGDGFFLTIVILNAILVACLLGFTIIGRMVDRRIKELRVKTTVEIID